MNKDFKHTIRLDEAHETMLRDICAFENMTVTEALTMLIGHWAEEIAKLDTPDEDAYLIGAIDMIATGETAVTLEED